MYLLSTDYQLLNGAANGLFMNGHASEKDIHQLAEHLESEDKQLRQAALTSLQRFGPAARPALPKLLERFGSESDPQIVLALTEAISAIGMDAIDPLIEEGKRLDLRVWFVCHRSVFLCGKTTRSPHHAAGRGGAQSRRRHRG
jgi:hypothetical protein